MLSIPSSQQHPRFFPMIGSHKPIPLVLPIPGSPSRSMTRSFKKRTAHMIVEYRTIMTRMNRPVTTCRATSMIVRRSHPAQLSRHAHVSSCPTLLDMHGTPTKDVFSPKFHVNARTRVSPCRFLQSYGHGHVQLSTCRARSNTA